MVKGKYAYLPEYILLTLYNGIQPWLPDKDPEKRFGRMPFLKRVQGKKVPHLFFRNIDFNLISGGATAEGGENPYNGDPFFTVRKIYEIE
jgi:hypothetical protein